MRKCIEHLVVTSEHAVWFNITFSENVTVKKYATKCWNRLVRYIVKKYPNFRLVGIWARQGRGAWHVHAVCNQRFDIEQLRNWLIWSGFGKIFYVKEIDSRPQSPEKIARYITGYVTDKNCLDPEKDKGVRRMIFVGKHVRVVDMRYKSSLKQVTSRGKAIAEEVAEAEYQDMSEFERDFSPPGGRKKVWETWGDWYRRNRDYWFKVGWESLSDDERREMCELDGFCVRYFETGRWSFV